MGYQDAPVIPAEAASATGETPQWMKAPKFDGAAPKLPLPAETTAGDIGGSIISSVLNIPHSLAHAAVDAARRTGLSSTPVGAPDPAFVQGLDMSNPASIATAGHIAANPIVQHVAGAVNDVVQHVPAPIRNAAGIASDVGQLAAPLIPAASLLKEVAGGADAAEAAATPAYRLGFRNGEGQPIAKFSAGDSGQPALKINNQQAGDTTFLSEAGVTPGTKPDAAAFTAAREAPNSVYNRAAASVPTTTLSPAAQSGIADAGGTGARMTSGSPDAAAAIGKLKSQFLDDPAKAWTGDQVVNEIRGLRQEGFARIGSEDPDSVALGRAQLSMSNALGQHIADNLPTNAPVSVDQLAQARVALAKNHTVESAMAGDNVDLAKLGRLANNDRDLMTGPMADATDFINNNQAVIGLPGKVYEKPGMMTDFSKLGSKSLLNVGTIPAALGNIFGVRTAARAALTGGARDAIPVTGLGGEFDELPMNHLTPPPGAVGAPHQPDIGPLPQGLGSRGSLELQPSPGDLSPQQRALGALPQGEPPRPGLGLELSPGAAYSPNQPQLGPMAQGPGSPGNLALTPPPGQLDPYQRALDLGEEITPKKKPKGK